MAETDDGLIDVTSFPVVLWSYGEHAKRIVNDRQLDNIICVVDKDVEKQGDICLRGKRCCVISPEELRKAILPKDCLVLIGSDLYKEAIYSDISDLFKDRFVICKDEKNLIQIHKDIRECILFDPILNRKTYEGNCSTLLPECVSVAEKMVSNLDVSSCKYYSAIDAGHKLSVCIRNNEFEPCYVFQFSFWEQWDWRISPMQNDVLVAVNSACKQLEINRELICFSEIDADSKWCAEMMHAGVSDLEFNEENMVSILSKIKRIHYSGLSMPVYIDPWTRIDFLRHKLRNTKKREIDETEKIDGLIKKECRNYESVLIHGDFHHGNILKYRNEPFIIDWESMCMSDPMYDICRFVFYLRLYDKKTISDEEVLSIYFGNDLKTTNKRHYYAMMLFCEYVEYLLQLMYGNASQELVKHLIESIMRYKEEYAI